MTGDQIVHVTAMWNGLMPAIRTMNVSLLVHFATMLGCATLRIGGAHLNPVLVYAITAYVVQMPIVKVIDMTVVPHSRVPATGTVRVSVAFVSRVCFRHEILLSSTDLRLGDAHAGSRASLNLVIDTALHKVVAGCAT
jgi:hypothetical protein